MASKPRFKLTFQNYYDPKRPHISRSQITDYLKSPEYYKRKYIDRSVVQKLTAPMQRGSMVDYILTQWDKKKPLPYVKKFERTCYKKDNPETYALESAFIEGQERVELRYLVTPGIFDQAMSVVNEIVRQPYWQDGLKTAQFQVVLEGKLEGLKVCGLPDRLDSLPNGHYRMIDVKCVNPIKIDNPKKWLWNAKESGYIHQAALYQHLLAEREGIPRTHIEFCHVVGAPVDDGYAISAIYKIPQRLIDEAMLDIRKALRGIKAKNFAPKLMSWRDVIVLDDGLGEAGVMSAEEEAEELL